jgi:hypothetical protein
VHSRKSSHGGHKSPIDHQFFDEVAHALADHPTDAEVLAYARRHFTAIDRMFPPSA